jgi:hypothetical protein
MPPEHEVHDVPDHFESIHLEHLSRDECILRLQARGVGRVGATVRGRPVIYPVNYAVHEDAIVFRTRRGGELDLATAEAVAAFEIDGADNLYHEGWCVLVVGRTCHVSDPAEFAGLKDVRLSPWAGEDRDCFVRISFDEVSGRNIHHRAT